MKTSDQWPDTQGSVSVPWAGDSRSCSWNWRGQVSWLGLETCKVWEQRLLFGGQHFGGPDSKEGTDLQSTSETWGAGQPEGLRDGRAAGCPGVWEAPLGPRCAPASTDSVTSTGLSVP